MALYKSRGIVLRSMRYGEADRILDLYTDNRGLISAIVKGVRRPRSRFGACLEPLSCVEIVAYEGRSLDTITQAQTLHSFQAVRDDLSRLGTAWRMVGGVRALSGGDEADRRVFNLLYRALESLTERTSGLAVAEAAFGLKLSVLAGYAPQFDACSGCGELPGEAHFAPDLGGVLCPDCRTASRETFPLPPGAQERLSLLMERPMREAPEDEWLSESLLRVVRSHITAHAPGNPVPMASRQRSPA